MSTFINNIKKLSPIFESDRNFYIVVFVALLVANFPFGFQYFRFSDDYNLYGVFSLFRQNIWQYVMVDYALYGMRPLAGFTDAYIIAWFWDSLHFVLLAIVVLRFFTIVLLDKIFARSGITWGRVAAIFFGFFPASTESAYWISAASRIVTSGFLSALAAYAILKFVYKEKGRWIWFSVAMVSGLLAQGYYEQGVIFSFVVTLGVLIIHRKAVTNKILYLWPFINLAIIGAHYYIFRNIGHLAHRTEVAEHSFFRQIYIVLEKIYLAYIWEQAPTIVNTITWGFAEMLRENTLLTISVLILAILLTLFVVFDKDKPAQKPVFSLLSTVILFSCTFGVFFIIAQSFVWVRNLYFSLIGLAIAAEIIMRAVPFNKHVFGRVGKAGIAFCVTLVFISGFVMEVESLRRLERDDSLIIQNLSAAMIEHNVDENDTVWLLGLWYAYDYKISPRIASQVRFDWALLGHWQVYNRTTAHRRINPIMRRVEVCPSYDDILFGIDDYLNVRLLFHYGRYLFFADTGERFYRNYRIIE